MNERVNYFEQTLGASALVTAVPEPWLSTQSFGILKVTQLFDPELLGSEFLKPAENHETCELLTLPKNPLYHFE